MRTPMAVAVIALAGFIGSLAGFLVGTTIFQNVDRGVERVSSYVQVAEYVRVIEPVSAMSTEGVVEIPIPGRVNVIVPQYVLCPDVCHWETNIMIYAFREVLERGLQDHVVFVTISVDPWFESLEDARRYQLEKAGDFIEKGIRWIWVHDSEDVMRKLWSMLGIYVEPYPEEKLVDHTAGFIIVDANGVMRYYVSPTSEGWIRGQHVVAEALVEKILEVASTG